LSRVSWAVLTVLLAEASLELVPKRLQRDRRVVRAAARRGKDPSEMLLDSSYLGPDLVRRADPSGKRGRPDVVHRSLLALTDSPPWREGWLRIYLHTVEGRMFELEPGLRPPRSYNRFVGLMEALLRDGRVGPPDMPLIREADLSPAELVGRLNPDLVMGLTASGGLANPLEILDPELEEMAVVGCFPAGDFSEEIRGLFDSEVSLYEGVLSASTVASAVAWAYYVVRRWGGR